MGFCLFNNIAIAAKWILKEQPKWKILVVDWDVHHGNGTQHIFWEEPRVLYFSVHRADLYPTGEELESHKIGGLEAQGFNVNVPLNGSGYGDADYLAIWDHILIPIAAKFSPDIIIISGGFDAATGDELGMLEVTPSCYHAMMTQLMQFAQGRIIMALEGGYNLNSTADCLCACVAALLGDPPTKLPSNSNVDSQTWDTILQVHKNLECYWEVLSQERAKIETSLQRKEEILGREQLPRKKIPSIEAEKGIILANKGDGIGKKTSSSKRDPLRRTRIEAEKRNVLVKKGFAIRKKTTSSLQRKEILGREQLPRKKIPSIEAEKGIILANKGDGIGKKTSSSKRVPIRCTSIEAEKRNVLVKKGFAIRKKTTSSTRVSSSDYREKRQKRKCKSFRYYLIKVLKQSHPNRTLSARAVQVMVDFVYDMFDKLALEASTMVRRTKRKTLTARDVEHAVRVLLPRELAKHGVSEGTKAMHNSNLGMIR